ncbi:MAG: hypothetical protein MR210_02305 [Erysipelotrichaceae bacterium]|nr:hypothetical protein [Erysipelotrichaceae bacterium]MDY5251211.1 hypothetical protein [Erysipelotrichaceae bacterium]
MYKYGYPLLVMIISGIISRLMAYFGLSKEVVIIVMACCYFAFGLSLFQRKRSNAWVQKLIVAFLFLFFVLWDCGYVVIPQLKSFFDFIGISGFVVKMFYIYCGYIFFD